MNDSETTVCEYLKSLRIGSVRYEPDGNVPPDFLVDGRVAVEARRLNEHEEVNGIPRGLEVTAKPLHRAMVKALRASGPPDGHRSWYVHYTVRRPLPTWKDLAKSLGNVVQEFRERLDDPPAELRVGRAIRLRFLPAGRTYDTLLVLGGSADHDSGGFVVAELLRNLKICIAEKNRKVAPVRHKYGEWWLALEDRVAYGALDRGDVREVREALGHVPGFVKVLLVSPIDPTRGIDILA